MRRLALTIVGLPALVCGCGEGAPSGTYVGRLQGSDAWIAISVGQSRAVAFVSGGEQTLETHTRWLQADVGSDALSFEQDGWRLEVFLNDLWAAGDYIDPEGNRAPFRIDLVDEGGVSGLYTAVDSGCRNGVIVHGTSPYDFESSGAWCDSQGNIAPAEPSYPLEESELGVRVTARTVHGVRQFFATEVEPTMAIE